MSINGLKRKRAKRGVTLEVRPSGWAAWWSRLRDWEALTRLSFCLLGALAIWISIVPWNPTFPHRMGTAPQRPILANVAFKHVDERATENARDQSAREVCYVYSHNPSQLVRVREVLHNELLRLVAAEMPPPQWEDFLPLPPPEQPPLTDQAKSESFQLFKASLTKEGALPRLEKAIADALQPYERHGILDRPPDFAGPGSPTHIVVFPATATDQRAAGVEIPISEVMLGTGAKLQDALDRQVESVDVAAQIYHWLKKKLPATTLTYQAQLTQLDRDKAKQRVAEVVTQYEPGQTLARGGSPLGDLELQLLWEEYLETRRLMPWWQRVLRAASALGMILTLFALCGYYLVYHESVLLEGQQRLSLLLLLSVATVALARWLSLDPWQAEIIPLLFFAMIVAIAYRQDVSLVLTSTLALVIVFGLGHNLGSCVLLCGTAATSIFMLARVRSRRKVVQVGLAAGLVALGLNWGIGILQAQPLEGLTLPGFRLFGWAVLTGFLVSGSLPFLEHRLGVVTDISLLELGDVAHPLLQELVRRAPGTYNHSINVASMADPAAESIGANGLLVRVGAYFHDIGKMLKPGYFIENQGQAPNRHDSLAPEMSTLIIIAHVKDGADLGRQHNLPQSIIDFIEQHHGTTLVQYFYALANRRQEGNPDASSVLENDFRYPGPKPQTKEAGVLMLADAVESASRVLVEPTPARIRNLVERLTMDRLMDGQFDESGLNLRELKQVQESLVKSLIAMYHGRIRYPEHVSASAGAR